ncbi:unnamed protein product [Kuraishia capsulata CBS 1993]|uniref:Large ribosomal subunit protein bL34m n=1 Tax=Kuraishia capsulata CBS 1993 TaxID=1382522 RepID=W6MX78_9ASCO|nr:uncharacterized protein KUCA_T00004397001 [Kuraishia capsulata CBS 1993]CDK28415.1 unnamed protein product [Kuraishia capsulata CBS 1993]
MFSRALLATRPIWSSTLVKPTTQCRNMTITSFKTPMVSSVNRVGLQSFIEQRLTTGIQTPHIILTPSPLQAFLQRRWGRGGFRGGNRGNTYQPNTLKRKRRLGFLSRMCSRTGRRIIKNRKEKGRWFLSY